MRARSRCTSTSIVRLYFWTILSSRWLKYTWNADIVAYMKVHNYADARALQVYFNQRLLKIVQKYIRTMLGWDDILFPGLPTDAVIHAWRDQKSLFDAAAQGY